MTPEQKGLLLKDLCARLPYGVICRCDEIKAEGTLREIGINYNMCRLYDSFTDESEDCYIFDCKPYLFPLSSMTEEQREEALPLLNNCDYYTIDNTIKWLDNHPIKFFDWCNKNHFDYRGLIPMGLAIDVTGLINIY